MNCFICPLSKKKLTDPVVAADGYTYEKSAIEDYFNSGKTVSPITGNELTDKTLIPNKTLRSLILNNSISKLEELQQKYLETKAENLVAMNSSLKSSDILKMLKEIEEIYKKYKGGIINVDTCMKELEKYLPQLQDDDELQQEYILLCYWTQKYEKAKPTLEILAKCPLFETLKPLLNICLKAKTNKEEAKEEYDKLCKLKEDNLFRVRDLKYKAITLNALGKNQEAITHFDSYEVFVPFDPSIYVLFKAKAYKDMGMTKELNNFKADYFIKYGDFKDLNSIK